MTSVNNGFGPLPKKRGKNNLIFGGILSTMFLIGVVHNRYKQSNPLFLYDDVGLLCAVLSAVMLGRYVVRTLILFSEERCHVNARYSKSQKTALNACMTFTGQEPIILLVLLLGTWKYWTDSEHILFHWPAYILVALVSGVYPQRLARAEVSQLNETENKHVADGLAWSFYFGYLKLILPNFDGMISEAVKPKFEIGGDDIRNLLSCPKLLIVVPKDCYCYDSFDKIDKRINYKTSMPEQRKTRGGVQERVYKNTLYEVQVTPNNKPLYVMMEYATPVLSMYDMCRNTGAKFSKDDLSCQVQEFCKKLKEILDNDPECKERYELVLIKAAHNNLADVINNTVKNVSMSL